MNRRRGSFTTVATLALIALAALLPAGASAAPAPAWKFTITSQPTNFDPGASYETNYVLLATNVGAGTANGQITLEDTLPAGIVPIKTRIAISDSDASNLECDPVLSQTVKCSGTGPVSPGLSVLMDISVEVNAPDGAVLKNEATIEGGGALPVTTSTLTQISSSPSPFGFIAGDAGFSAPVVAEDGTPATTAGSHPYAAVIDLGVPTEKLGGGGESTAVLTGAGHLRDVIVDFPRGLLANPLSTPTRCTEVELASEGFPGCPDSSQVGLVTLLNSLGSAGASTTPLYNMVPPPGSPAAFSFDALGAGVFPHVIASVRTDGDFGAQGYSNDIIARGLSPILNVRTELWGDPSDPAHDPVRGSCILGAPPPCELEDQTTAFLALPADCPGEPLPYEAEIRSWEEPEVAREAKYESAALNEGPTTEIDGCNGLKFEPQVKAQPTTNLIDSPTGLDFSLHQPQELELSGLYTAPVKDTLVTLPEGMGVNASLANGLEACSSAQIGLTTPIGQEPIRFSKAPALCPDASKLGTLKASTPLLDHPLEGAVYSAKPFDNPFDRLTAIYLVIEDAKSGIVAKFAAEVIPNPVTGQLSTRVTEAPQLPLEDLSVNLFTGDRAPLQTPPTCATHTTTASLTPWSAPEGKDASLADSFTPSAAPGGGPCPATAAGAPNAPTMRAGTLSPQAGAFSPLVLNLSRADGTQRFASLQATLPPGLLAKLAGVPYCSEAEIAAAVARSQPNQGALEKASPSCPAASEVGTVDVGAGAGPNPLHVGGRAYLAGPYKGAPLSMAIITPAVAGPFDLGVVVVRSALHVDPNTGQGRAVSDPLPQILHGIPVDVRSVAVDISRPNFTLNPTNCNPLSFSASLTSSLGQAVPLAAHFQVGSCGALPFKPKLSTRLFGPTRRGANPRFRAILTAKPGEANIARTVVALPSSEFLDQAHIRTICTRVQYAADACPPGSVYGQIKATSPLLGYPLEGPIYLRSSSNELPDIVGALKGPAHQPIQFDLVGRVDSIDGGIRTTFETVPDAPVTKAIVTMQGASKGLLENSTNLCKGTHRVRVKMVGQNGKHHNSSPVLEASCPKKSKRAKGR
jgi:hypothetical protein